MSRREQEQLESQSQSQSTSYKRENQNWNLDPSLLIGQNLNRSADFTNSLSHKMTLRRRGIIQCQSSISSTSFPPSAPKHEIILPLNSTYLPKEEVRDNIQKTKNRSFKSSKDINERNDDGDECNKQQQQAPRNDKIFSIATYVALFIAFATLFGILCLCVCNRASLLVSAQYSNYAFSPNGNDHHHHSSGRSSQHLMNRQGDTSQSATVGQQADSLANHRDSSSPDIQIDPADERRWSKKNSIDRYDSGEQIRPPLLRQPTTLAPLKGTAQQASVNNQLNLQEAASQDSYLSPDEREQFMKSQDNHYEGKNLEAPLNSASYDGYQTDRDSYDKPGNNRWSQPLPETQEAPSAKQSGSLDYQPSRPEPSTAARSSNQAENDDGDYEEEEPVKKSKTNLVPETRRGVATGSSHNHQRPSVANRKAAAAAATLAANEAAANEESDLNDDYGGGSDDSHFSRKSQQQDRSPQNLNLAASHNQQLNRGFTPSGRGGYTGEAPQRGGANNAETGYQDEGQGFGPGPNEAYIAEKAEVGRDQDGDESLYGPSESSQGESNGLGNGEEGGESGFDRRSMSNPYTGSGASSGPYAASPATHHGQRGRAQANLIDNGEPEGDSEDGNDNADESGSSSAPSLKTEVKSRAIPMLGSSNERIYNSNNNNNNMSPKTSASAPSPQSATFSQSSSPMVLVPSPLLAGTKPTPPVANQQPFYNRQQVQVNRQTQNQFVNNVATTSQPTTYQRASLNAPYNPQNNPSHAGKYFIN